MGAITIDHNGGDCALFNITSATLGKLFGAVPKIGDRQGVIGVELSRVGSNQTLAYAPNDIQTASLSVAPSDPTSGC